jgi:hypothetical protein
MDYKPDISFEYDYIRIVYEVILTNLRTNKKVVEKDLNTVVTRLQNMKKKQMNNTEMLSTVKQLIAKTEELEKKYEQICDEENILYECLRERITQLQMIDDKNFKYDNLKQFCEKKIKNLLLDFFLRERFLETAKDYIEEEKITVNILC